MAVDLQQTIFSEIADFLVSQPKHIDLLLEKNGEGDLSPEERLELDKILAVASVMDLAKVKAKLKLADAA